MNNECQWSLPVFQTNLEKTSPVAGDTVNKTGLQPISRPYVGTTTNHPATSTQIH